VKLKPHKPLRNYLKKNNRTHRKLKRIKTQSVLLNQVQVLHCNTKRNRVVVRNLTVIVITSRVKKILSKQVQTRVRRIKEVIKHLRSSSRIRSNRVCNNNRLRVSSRLIVLVLFSRVRKFRSWRILVFGKIPVQFLYLRASSCRDKGKAKNRATKASLPYKHRIRHKHRIHNHRSNRNSKAIMPKEERQGRSTLQRTNRLRISLVIKRRST
jgi:hypothetical protein